MRGKKNREVNIFSASVVDLFASGLGVFLIVSIIALINQKKETYKALNAEKTSVAGSGELLEVDVEEVNKLNAEIKSKNSEIIKLKMEVIKAKEEQQEKNSNDGLDIALAQMQSEFSRKQVELEAKNKKLKEQLKVTTDEVKKLKKSIEYQESLRISEKIKTDPKFNSFGVGTKVRLDNVQFYPGTDRGIEPYASREIQEFAMFLRNNPKVTIEVSGHIYETKKRIKAGKAEDEYNLSGRRAKFVCERLVAFGVNPKRLRCVGYGAERPVHLTDDQYSLEAQLNRRVEIEILSK